MSQPEIYQSKHELRSRMRDVLQTIPDEVCEAATIQIANATLLLDEINNAHTICLYLSLPKEVGTHQLFNDLKNKHKRIAVPKIFPEGLRLFEVKDLSQLIMGPFGILEPADTFPLVDITEIDCFIIPGLAFDRKGHRLGRGRGYFDRFLEHANQPKIALAFEEQVVPMVPYESYDIVMDVIVTETKIITTKN